jgi:Mce-associated membrane protein
VSSDSKADEPEVDKPADDETSAATQVAESDRERTEDDIDSTDSEEAPFQPRDTVMRRTLRRAQTRIGLIVLAASFVASAGLAPWLYYVEYRPDRQTDPAAAKVALEAASNGSVALLSYSPDSLVKDFAAAKAHLTGDFLSYYTQFTEQFVTPAATQKSVKTSAVIVRSAVAEMHPDSAVIFLFINQTMTSKENPAGTFAASAVKVGMKKINGSWLISSFDPV